MVRTNLWLPLLALLALGVSFSGLPKPHPAEPTPIGQALRAAFAKAPAGWASRLEGDEILRDCSQSANQPADAVARQIQARARASIRYPGDGRLMGDWRSGERIAQSGAGLRFTDDPVSANGGNCYACHQLTRAEISYGTIGPSLLGYGRIRKFAAADVAAAYDKIFNSHATVPCSAMPRFGTNGVLSIEQIRDLTALLMSPDSPVNAEVRPD